MGDIAAENPYLHNTSTPSLLLLITSALSSHGNGEVRKSEKKLKEDCLTSFSPRCYFWSALKRRRRRASHRRPPFSQMTGPLCIFEAKWLFEDRSTILYHIDAMFWHEGQFSKGFLFKNYLHHVCIEQSSRSLISGEKMSHA